MQRICPQPGKWNEIYQKLCSARPSSIKPPIPLILSGWWYSNDIDKKSRWQETIQWAEAHGCSDIINSIPENDYYTVGIASDYDIGPLGGPMYRPWNFERKIVPSSEQLSAALENLRISWIEITGPELGSVTYPLAFSGLKGRRLIVNAVRTYNPPWGGWSFLSEDRKRRRTFTVFREAINKKIDPHEVDHIDFIEVASKDQL